MDKVFTQTLHSMYTHSFGKETSAPYEGRSTLMRMRFRLSRTNYVRSSAGGTNSAVPGCSLAQSQARTPVERNWANAMGV